MNRSFIVRILCLFGAVFLLTAVVLSVSAVLYQRETGRRQIVQEGRTLARLMALNARPFLFAKDDVGLDEMAREFLENSGALALSILDSHQHEILTLRSEGAVGEEGRAAHFLHKISDPPYEAIGYARVILDKNRLGREAHGLLIRHAILGLILLAGAGLLLYPPLRGLSRSLFALNSTVRAVGMGEEVETLPVRSEDEVGELTRSVNVMIKSLEKRTKEHSLLEDKLRHAQKMEAVGTLARGISHDFNNILATIKGAVHILQKKFGEEPVLQRYAVKIEKSVTQANRLIEGLITFSRTKMLHYKTVDLNRLLERMKPLIIDITEESGIEVHIFLSRELVLVSGDAFCLEQVIWNLCLNARDVMPEGGTLTIRTNIETRRERVENGEPAGPHLQYALVAVSDTGSGIDEDTQKRIFEPFFTTKETGKGTGLGLSVVHGIIEQHYGRTEVESKDGEGTTFTILLPLSR